MMSGGVEGGIGGEADKFWVGWCSLRRGDKREGVERMVWVEVRWRKGEGGFADWDTRLW